MRRLIVYLIMMVTYVHSFAQRMLYLLNDTWLLVKEQTTVTMLVDKWEKVVLPHSWNIEDGQASGENRLDNNGQALLDGIKAHVINPVTKFGYYRGKSWYYHKLDVPSEWKDKRFFSVFKLPDKLSVCISTGKCWENTGGIHRFCYELVLT